MLAAAATRLAPWNHRLVQGNAAAANDSLGKHGLVTATGDVINHLGDEGELEAFFALTARASETTALLVADFNTRRGLAYGESTTIFDTATSHSFSRNVFIDPFLYIALAGFITHDGINYLRYEERFIERVFEIDEIRRACAAAGWRRIEFRQPSSLDTVGNDPEMHPRLVLVASRNDHPVSDLLALADDGAV